MQILYQLSHHGKWGLFTLVYIWTALNKICIALWLKFGRLLSQHWCQSVITSIHSPGWSWTFIFICQLKKKKKKKLQKSLNHLPEDLSSSFHHPTTCSFRIWQTSWSLNRIYARTSFLLSFYLGICAMKLSFFSRVSWYSVLTNTLYLFSQPQLYACTKAIFSIFCLWPINDKAYYLSPYLSVSLLCPETWPLRSLLIQSFPDIFK